MRVVMSLFKFGFTSSKRKESDNGSNNEEHRKEQKKTYEQKRQRRYLGETWERKYIYYPTADGNPDGKTNPVTWITYDADSESMFCSVCLEFPSIADKESSLFIGCKNMRDAPLKSHNQSVKHQNCFRSKLASLYPNEQPMNLNLTKISDKNKEYILALINSAFFIVKTNMAFRRFPELMELQKKNKLAIMYNYLNDKSCRMFVHWIAERLKQTLQEDVNNARFLSILSDGSTDSGNIETEIVYARYLKDGVPNTKFAGIEPINSADAPGVLSAIETGMKNALNLESVDSVYQKLIICNFDGASVMSGKNAGVQALMKVKRPGMIYVHCIAHVLELAVLDSIKSDAFLLEFENTLEAIFLMYYYSPKLTRDINVMAELTGEVMKHFGGMKKIRWVASRIRALEALANNYHTMTVHMEHMASQNIPSASDNYAKALGYLSNVKKFKFLQYLHFMIDFVHILRSLSLIF